MDREGRKKDKNQRKNGGEKPSKWLWEECEMKHVGNKVRQEVAREGISAEGPLKL